MKVFTKLPAQKSLPHRFHGKLCLAIGNFDGVHRGHQALLKQLHRTAKRIRGTSAILTFVRHPRTILDPHHPHSLLTPGDLRFELIKASGIDLCFLLQFTKTFSALSPEKFVKDILLDRLGVHTVYMGYNAKFGHHRKGNAQTMKRLSRRYGFHFHAIRPHHVGNTVINSTKIRNWLKHGKIREAHHGLGRYPTLVGKVVHGSRRGRTLGFPTANLDIDNCATPARGVYAVRVDIIQQKRKYVRGGFYPAERLVHCGMRGLLNVGARPTFRKSVRLSFHSIQNPENCTAEVFLLNFNKNLYGKCLKVSLIKYLREERKFKAPDDLVLQIYRDIAIARKYL